MIAARADVEKATRKVCNVEHTVVSTELAKYLSEPRLYCLPDLASDSLAAGEGDHVDVRASDYRLSNSFATSNEACGCARDAVLL